MPPYGGVLPLSSHRKRAQSPYPATDRPQSCGREREGRRDRARCELGPLAPHVHPAPSGRSPGAAGPVGAGRPVGVGDEVYRPDGGGVATTHAARPPTSENTWELADSPGELRNGRVLMNEGGITGALRQCRGAISSSSANCRGCPARIRWPAPARPPGNRRCRAGSHSRRLCTAHRERNIRAGYRSHLRYDRYYVDHPVTALDYNLSPIDRILRSK